MGTTAEQRLLISAQSYAAETNSRDLCLGAERWVRAHFPVARDLLATCHRTADVAANGVPVIGPIASQPGLYLVLGDSAHSMTFAAIAAVRLADMLTSSSAPPSASRRSIFMP